MTIASEITRIKTNIENAYTKAEEKGATMPELLNSENLAGCIESVPKGSEGGGGGNEYDAPDGYYHATYYDIDGTILYRDVVKAETNYTISEKYVGKYDPENLKFSGWFSQIVDNNINFYSTPMLQNLHYRALYMPIEEEKDYIFITANEDLGNEFKFEFILSKNTNPSQYSNSICKILIEWGDGETEYVSFDECIDDGKFSSYNHVCKSHIYSDGNYKIKLSAYNSNDNLITEHKTSSSSDLRVFFSLYDSAKMITKIYTGCRVGSTANSFANLSNEFDKCKLKNLEVISEYFKYDGQSFWTNSYDVYIAEFLDINTPLATLIFNSNNSLRINTTNIEYVFGSTGLNYAYSGQHNFKNISFLDKNLWYLYNEDFDNIPLYQNLLTIHTLPSLANEETPYPLLKHYDKNFMFKGEDIIFCFKDVDDIYKKKYFTFSEYLNFIDSDEFNNKYKQIMFESGYIFNSYRAIPLLGSLDLSNSFGNKGLITTQRTLYCTNMVTLKSEQVDGLYFNNTERFFGDFVYYPDLILKDANNNYYGYAQTGFENLRNIKSFKIHPLFKDINFYFTNKPSFKYLSKYIKELDLRNINFKQYQNNSYTNVAEMKFDYTYLEKILLHEDVTQIGSENVSSNNQMFYYSNAVKIDLTPWDGKSINMTEMFYNCPNLTKIIFPNNFTSIGKLANNTSPSYSYLVNSCESLTEIEIPKEFTFIAGKFITQCTNLKKIWISSETCKNIYTNSSYYPFSGCTNTNLIIYTDATEKPSEWADNWNQIGSSKYAKVYWGATKENYENGDPVPEATA